MDRQLTSVSGAPEHRVLIIEDDADTRDGLAMLLAEEGYEVATAENGCQALARIREAPPGLVITDLDMPALGGFSLIQALRSKAGTEELPIIIVSGHDRSSLRAAGLDLGADDFMVKPVAADELLARVRRQLRRAEAHRALKRASIIDELTGVLNRRGIYHVLSRELEQRRGQELTLAVIDIDDFKHINDTYGHSAGDVALCAVAAELQSVVRATDRVGRFGGDEFMLVLPNVGANAVPLVIDRLRESVPIRAQLEPGTQIELQLSVGSARAQPGDTVESLLERADAAMYAQKQAKQRKAPAS